MLPNPGATKRTRALHRTIPLEAATGQLCIAQSVAIAGVHKSKVELQRAVANPSAIAKDKDAGRMAQGTSILVLQNVIMLC